MSEKKDAIDIADQLEAAQDKLAFVCSMFNLVKPEECGMRTRAIEGVIRILDGVEEAIQEAGEHIMTRYRAERAGKPT